MSFWKKLFKGKKELPASKASDPINLKNQSDLEQSLTSLIKPATLLKVASASSQPENSEFISQFGGQPYFEKDESWPTNKKGKPLDFIFQVFNSSDLQLPSSIELIQFYYDWNECPWETSSDGWLVKIYKTVNKENALLIDKPTQSKKSKYCEINFQPIQSLPNWEGLEEYSTHASMLSSKLDEEEPWEAYDMAVNKLIGQVSYQSQLGGYPSWVQGDETPQDKEGKSTQLLFQINSEYSAGLQWGDAGFIYVFYDEQTEQIEFTLQCH